MSKPTRIPEVENRAGARVAALLEARGLLATRYELGAYSITPPVDPDHLIRVARFIETGEGGSPLFPLTTFFKAAEAVPVSCRLVDEPLLDDAGEPIVAGPTDTLPTEFGACGTVEYMGSRFEAKLLDPGDSEAWMIFDSGFEIGYLWVGAEALSAFIPGTMDPTGSLA